MIDIKTFIPQRIRAKQKISVEIYAANGTKILVKYKTFKSSVFIVPPYLNSLYII